MTRPDPPAARPENSAVCPVNNRPCKAVALRTVLHHVREPWRRADLDRAYYFCADPDCPVVYFDRTGAVIGPAELRTAVGCKSAAAERTVCYCFDITWRNILAERTLCRDFVVAQTAAGRCACAVRNPSGTCCLRDFPPA